MQLKYYKQAQTSKRFLWFFSLRFPLVFPLISSSILISGNIFKKIILLLKWLLFQKNQGVPKDKNQLERQLPMQRPIFNTSQNQIRYTWIGHSTAVISIGSDINILIDPVFSQRASPFQWIGPKRFRKPACEIEQLPFIDLVLVSHDHYDHLDTNSLQYLQRQHKPTFFAGLQSKDVFPKNCNLIELNWTQSRQLNIKDKCIKITFVPAAHWSRRGLFDYNKRLWGGFVIETPNKKKIYYSGDTGYCQIFKELNVVFGGFDLSILPIGAYKPRQFLLHQHIDPKQAVQIHKQINSKKSVGVHWGTFPLGNQHFSQAKKLLHEELIRQEIDENNFETVNQGGSFTIHG